MRIVIVEDEQALAEVLQFNLEGAGFQVTVYQRGDDAWEGLRALPPDLVLLDLMLPGLDGLELARLMKRDDALAGVPVMMLTAKSEEVDRIVGLELGADDYISKPFSPREVVLRVKAVLRRAQGQEAEPVSALEVGTVRLHPEAHQVFLDGQEVPLTPIEYRLLYTLMARPGRTQTRNRLLADVWGYSEEVDSRTVDTHIRRLRKKLGAEAERIETVMGVGYRLRR